MSHYHQTSPESDFTQKRICTRLTLDGRVSLTDNRLIATRDGQRTETAIADDTQFADALLKHFGIILPSN